jgi:phosphatidylglycerol:prolipoprotein diacylglycerol transferase
MNFLGAIFVNIDPELFHLGPITIGWYGLMVTLAVITIVTWAILNARKDKRITTDMAINAALAGIPSGIIGARLMHVIDHLDFYIHNPGRIIGGDGLSIWGAVLGAALGIWIYNKVRHHSFAHMADMLAPGIILAQAVGRVGCTILGDDFGKVTGLPWGFVYTSPNSPAYVMGLTPTQPVVTYEIFFDLIVFAILLMLRKKLRPDGSLFVVYLGLYSIWRIASDFMRNGTNFLFGLHEAQVIGIITLIVAIVFIAFKTRWVKNFDETVETVETKTEEKPQA